MQCEQQTAVSNGHTENASRNRGEWERRTSRAEFAESTPRSALDRPCTGGTSTLCHQANFRCENTCKTQNVNSIAWTHHHRGCTACPTSPRPASPRPTSRPMALWRGSWTQGRPSGRLPSWCTQSRLRSESACTCRRLDHTHQSLVRTPALSMD